MAELQPPVNEQENKGWLTKSLYCMLILVVIGAFSGLAVSFTNRITAPVIAANEHAQLLEMLAGVMPEAEEYKLVTTENGLEVYFGIKNREVFAAVVPGAGKGFNGDSVDTLTIVNSEGKIERVVVHKHKETPGWGEKIEEPLFLAQFEGISRSLPAGEEPESEDILIAGVDIISGATISSQAVLKGVAHAMELYSLASID